MSIRYYNDGTDVKFRDEVPLPPSKKGPTTASDDTKQPLSSDPSPKPPTSGPLPDTADLFAKAMDEAISEGKGWKPGEREKYLAEVRAHSLRFCQH